MSHVISLSFEHVISSHFLIFVLYRETDIHLNFIIDTVQGTGFLIYALVDIITVTVILNGNSQLRFPVIGFFFHVIYFFTPLFFTRFIFLSCFL